MAYPIEGTYISLETKTDFSILLGIKVTCAAPPAPCTLAITNVTSTDETVLGAGDGTITITTTGRTGSTNVTYTVTKGVYVEEFDVVSSTHTFTGLTTGQWTVNVDQGACYDEWGSVINILQGTFVTSSFTVNTADIPTIVASENPIVFEVRTQATGLQPKQGIYKLTINNVSIAENNRILFDLMTPEYSTTIWLKEFPNRSNYALCSILSNQLGVQLQTNTYTDIAQSIGEAIKADIVLSQYYYVSVDSNVITLKTKEATSKYNLINGSNIFIYNENGVESATGITFSTTVQGQDAFQGSQTDGYQIYAELYTSDVQEFGGTIDYNSFYPVAELILPYTSDNSIRFNFSDTLKNYVYTPAIDFTFTGFTTILPALRPYYVNYGEKFFLVENSSTKKKREKGNTKTTMKYVLNASLPWEDVNDMTAYLGEPATNIRPDMNITSSQSYPDTTVRITNSLYLPLSAATGTTNVMYNVYDDVNDVWKGWQTGTSFTLNPFYAGAIKITVSGLTDGEVYQYTKGYSVYDHYNSPINNPSQQAVILNDVNFLTRAPNPKQVQRTNNQEFLYFILQKDYTYNLDLRGDIYFYDGSVVNNYKFFDITTSLYNFGGVVALNISSDKLGLPALEVSGGTFRKIKTIEFAIHQDKDGSFLHYSEVRSFRYAIDEAERSFSCMFLNSLGGYDNFTFAGINERSVERTSGIFTLPREYNLFGASPHSFNVQTTYNTQTVKTIVCNSGWINSEMFDWLIELLKSNYIVSSSETNQNYINVVSFAYKKSSLEDLFDMEVVFRYTTYENNIAI